MAVIKQKKTLAEIRKIRSEAGKKGALARAMLLRGERTKTYAELERAGVKQTLDQTFLRATKKLAHAQLSIAQGSSFLFHVHTNTKTGMRNKPERIEDLEIIESYLSGELQNDNEDYYYITTKEPNNNAIESIFDRVHGKAKETLDVNQTHTFNLAELAREREMLNGNKDMRVLDAPLTLPAA